MEQHLTWFACRFAKEKHKDQRYAKYLPYSRHLEAVVGVLSRFNINEDNLLAAAWLHDVVEDQGITVQEIKEKFGPEISDLVWRVTNEPGRNRRERATKTHPKIRACTEARVLKLADRIANIEACIHADGVDNLFSMYSKEYDDFVNGVKPGKGMMPNYVTQVELAEFQMWDYLAQLVKTGRELLEKDKE